MKNFSSLKCSTHTHTHTHTTKQTNVESENSKQQRKNENQEQNQQILPCQNSDCFLNLNKILNFFKKEEKKLSINSKTRKNISKINYWKKLKQKELVTIYYHIFFAKHYLNNFFDIKQVSGKKLAKLKIDCLTYSFPCQDISVQGKQKGLKNGQNSSLLWEILRILQEIKTINKNQLPKTLVLENVSALNTKRYAQDFQDFQKQLEELGYHSEHKVLKASNFGSCTARKRLIMISKQNNENIIWPTSTKITSKINDILQKQVSSDFYLPKCSKILEKANLKFKETKNGLVKISLPNYSKYKSETLVFDPCGLAPTLTATGALSRIKIKTNNNQVRTLTPLECYLLMGFEKQDFEVIKNVVAPKWWVFLAGNSIPIPLLQAVFTVNFK